VQLDPEISPESGKTPRCDRESHIKASPAAVDNRKKRPAGRLRGGRLIDEEPGQRLQRPRRRGVQAAGVAALSLQLAACATPDGLRFGDCELAPAPAPAPSTCEQSDAVTEIYARAGGDRTSRLELEVERLQADLLEAEESLVAIESGLLGVQGRADAASTIAESRIEVTRAARSAPWSVEPIEEARKKLDEAERQFQTGHSGSAVFFASRARRIAAALNDEAKRVANTPGTRFVDGRRVNLRAGPSTQDEIVAVLVDSTPVFPERREAGWLMIRTNAGMVGWIHSSLVRGNWSSSSQTKTQSLPASLAR
jgi:hypothetical protein